MADYYGKNGELLNLEGLLNPVNNGNITSNYGFRSDPETGRTAFHTGIDFGVGGATDRNTISMLNGEVIRYGNSSTLGNFVAVKLENGTSIVYGHLDSIDSSIVTGVSVPQGTILGVTGNTGKSTGIHSHISWINQDATDVIINNTTGVEAKSGLSIFLTPDTVIDPTEYVEKASPNSVLEIKLNNYTQNPDLENQTLEEIIEDIKIHQTAEKLRNPNQTLINDITNPDESTKPLAQNVANSNKLTINNVVETTYPVVSGDTFFEIADKLIAKGIINLRQELIDMNDGNIEDINKLEVGDKIIIKKDVGNQNYDVHSGDQEKSISDNPNVQKDENGNVKLLDSEGNEISQEEGIITGFSSGNGYVEDDAFTLVKEGVFVPLIDGTKALLSSVVEMTEVGVTNISNFFQSKIMGIFQPLFDEIFSSKEESKDENGDTAAQRLAGSILADIILIYKVDKL